MEVVSSKYAYRIEAKVLTQGLDMNYVCVIYGILGLVVSADWILRGRKSYLTNFPPAL